MPPHAESSIGERRKDVGRSGILARMNRLAGIECSLTASKGVVHGSNC